MKNRICRVCKSTAVKPFLDLGNQPHGDSFIATKDLNEHEPHYPLRACFCLDCTTAQIDYTVPKEVMFEYYPYVSGTTRMLKEHFEKSTERLIKKLKLKKGDFVVDIGSNDGTWLECYKNTGIRFLGIDGAKNLAKIANAKGLETWPKFFNKKIAQEVIAKKGGANLVTAAGVFFHLEELHSVTEGIAELIGGTGVLCVQAIYLGEMVNIGAFDQIYHEHLTYWTLRSIEHLLGYYGLEVFSVEFFPIHGGTIEYLIAKNGVRKIEPSVAAMRSKEKKLRLGDIKTFEKFGARVWEMKKELIPILRKYKKKEKRIFALGAPIKGSTLLNSFGIGTELVECAVEVNPLKIGKYIPGVRIPIKDERTAGEPDAYLVLPWNFLPELLRKMESYIKGGGAFIVPVPKPMVIDKNNYHKFTKK
ncbi:MAG: C-methyltransferase [Parcubacteria group bacterium Gr01-1014_17]|nr:MAG: C-methyltransferase [Parcubacteria group bacterium Gr01-1014_17]